VRADQQLRLPGARGPLPRDRRTQDLAARAARAGALQRTGGSGAGDARLRRARPARAGSPGRLSARRRPPRSAHRARTVVGRDAAGRSARERVLHLEPMAKAVEQRDSVVIRFAGDSGDGMQLTGGQFTSETAILGNDLSTFPDFPAEIRAPAGSLPGVSGFQLHFADHDILTPGDAPNVLVAMNPAALKTNLKDLPPSGILVVDSDAFTDRNLTKAGYDGNPLEDDTLKGYRVHHLPITTLNLRALQEAKVGLGRKEMDRCKNFFALGVLYWLYDRPLEPTLNWIGAKFKKLPEV